MTNPSELLSLRQAIARSEFAQQSQKPQNEASEVYTFAGYASGLDCKVKKANGEILNARLETNGMIKEGQVICCYQSGGRLLVRGMNKPYPENPNIPESKEKSRIKILYVKKTATNVELYIGGDRKKPKLISRFPLGTVIKGLCHNLGTGDKYSIGVTTELKIDATVSDRYVKTWKAGGGKSETTTIKAEWKNDRIQPLGHGFFAEGWMPKLLEKKWLFTTLNAAKTEKSLNFFDNKEVYKLRSMPVAAVIEAYVIRKALDDYNIIITAIAADKTRQVSILTKTAVEALPKVKPGVWIFEAIDSLIDKNGTTFLDKNLTGSAEISSELKDNTLALRIWQTAVGIFKRNSIATLRETLMIRPTQGDTQKKSAVGYIARDPNNLLEIKLTKLADPGLTFPDGSPLPQPGPDPFQPYAGWFYSWTVVGDHWARFPNATQYDPADRTKPNGAPYWTRTGICIGFKYYRAWDAAYLIDINLAYSQGFQYRPRIVTTEQQYISGYNGQFPQFSFIRGSLSSSVNYFDIHPIDYEHYEVRLIMRPDGYIAEDWDDHFEPPYRAREAVNWGPGMASLPAPLSKKGTDSLNPSTPTYNPWTIEDYLWNDPIVIGSNGESLWKNKAFIDYTGNPPKKPAAKKDEKLLKFKAAKPPDPIGGGLLEEIPEMTIAGKFPLLCSEDNLIGSKLFRVDRSVFYPSIPGTPNPRRSGIKKLFVETYSLGTKTEVTVKKYPIFPIPDDVEILSASFHL